MDIVEKYINGLKKAYFENNCKKIWEHFEMVIHGASKTDINKLRDIYQDIPDSLVKLLDYVDGTYWREYEGEKLTFYFLGSDVADNKYPYYLLSSKEMAENKEIVAKYYAEYIDREYGDEVEIDDRIIDCSEKVKWLHFSDCMNNGGTSQLFIDFTPSDKGMKGQVVRYLHDPDEIQVIANSFDDYLQMLIDKNYAFINKDTVEE